MKDKLFKVAVTGGICSGKSTIAKHLGSQIDCHYFNLDVFTDIIYYRNPFIFDILLKEFNMNDINNKHDLQQVNQLFNYNIIQTNNDKKNRNILIGNTNKNNLISYVINSNLYTKYSFNKKNLGKYIFSDKENTGLMKKLKAVMVPEILKLQDIKLNEIYLHSKLRKSKQIVFIEAPTVIENRSFDLYNEIWSCYCDNDTIRKRFKERIEINKTSEYNEDTLNNILQFQVDLETRKKYSQVMLNTSDSNTENNLNNAIKELNNLRQRI